MSRKIRPGVAAQVERTQSVLSLYFQPDEDDATRAGVRQQFVAALSAYPDWAVQQAFDQWVRSGIRRPSPGDIGLLARRALQPFTEEIARREKHAALSVDRVRVSSEAATEIMQLAGYGPKRMGAE